MMILLIFEEKTTSYKMQLLRLKEILKEKNITGKDLAASLDVSPNTISRIIKGTSFPSGDLLKALADQLDVDIRDLFHSTKEDNTYESIYIEKEGRYIPIGSLNLNK